MFWCKLIELIWPTSGNVKELKLLEWGEVNGCSAECVLRSQQGSRSTMGAVIRWDGELVGRVQGPCLHFMQCWLALEEELVVFAKYIILLYVFVWKKGLQLNSNWKDTNQWWVMDLPNGFAKWGRDWEVPGDASDFLVLMKGNLVLLTGQCALMILWKPLSNLVLIFFHVIDMSIVCKLETQKHMNRNIKSKLAKFTGCC